MSKLRDTGGRTKRKRERTTFLVVIKILLFDIIVLRNKNSTFKNRIVFITTIIKYFFGNVFTINISNYSLKMF